MLDKFYSVKFLSIDVSRFGKRPHKKVRILSERFFLEVYDEKKH